jgi:hypothetical protein
MMAVVMMKIAGLTSNDPRSSDDGSASASSPFESLSKFMFWCFVVVLCLASQIHLHGVSKFDEAVLMTGGMVRRCGWA